MCLNVVTSLTQVNFCFAFGLVSPLGNRRSSVSSQGLSEYPEAGVLVRGSLGMTWTPVEGRHAFLPLLGELFSRMAVLGTQGSLRLLSKEAFQFKPDFYGEWAAEIDAQGSRSCLAPPTPPAP